MARGRDIIPFSGDYRRPPKWGMGLPPERPRRRRPFWPKWVFFAVIAVIVLPGLADIANGFVKPGNGCRVVQVIDGDTVGLYCPERGTQRARLTGYDTPEIFSPKCPSEWLRGMAAFYYLRWQIWTAWKIAPVITGRDRYDRLLVKLWLDGENIAARMIAAEYARAYAGGQRAGWCA